MKKIIGTIFLANIVYWAVYLIGFFIYKNKESCFGGLHETTFSVLGLTSLVLIFAYVFCRLLDWIYDR